jgi:hypothetical protein
LPIRSSKLARFLSVARKKGSSSVG